MVKVCFALTQGADQDSEYLTLLDLQSFSRPNKANQRIQSKNPVHRANQSYSDMTVDIFFVSFDIGDKHFILLLHLVLVYAKLF